MKKNIFESKMENKDFSKNFIGHVAMMKIADRSFSNGQVYQISIPMPNGQKKTTFQINSYLMPTFFWGRGNTLQEALNNFILQCDENNRVPFIEPALFAFLLDDEALPSLHKK